MGPGPGCRSGTWSRLPVRRCIGEVGGGPDCRCNSVRYRCPDCKCSGEAYRWELVRIAAANSPRTGWMRFGSQVQLRNV